ncbi:MAG: NAD(P)-dependent oxidoreductase [Bacteroidota bacterium]
MKEKVLITGASGFLGFHLIEAALANNLQVFAAVRKSSNIDHLRNLPVTFTYPDFGNLSKLQEEIISGQYAYIIHAAGITKANSKQEYDLVNAGYSFNLGKVAEQAKDSIKKFIYISSLAAIGPLVNSEETINEFTPANPVTAYGKSKLMAEVMLQQLSIPLIILRPTAIYGPRDKDIFIFFKTIKKGLEPYLGSHKQQLSFIYAKDVADAAVKALFSPYNSSYNISDGNSYDRYDLAKYLKQYMRTKTLKFHLPGGVVKAIAFTLENTMKVFNKASVLNKEKLNELLASNWICDIEKARKELGFRPMYNLDTGVKESLEWYQQYKWL